MKINAKQLHYACWNWIAAVPGREKCSWPGFADLPVIKNNCFACVACSGWCYSCPLEWLGANNSVFGSQCLAEGSPYAGYVRSYGWLKSEYALLVRDMPWKGPEIAYVDDAGYITSC